MFFGLLKKKNEVAVAEKSSLAENEKRGTLYLVDFENVHDEGLEGIENVRAIDHVIIFYGPLIRTIGFETHLSVGKSPALVEHIRTNKTAKNYLDFQLTTYTGYVMAKEQYESVRIISKDTGFDSVVDFWTARGKDIKRRKNIDLAMSGAEERPERIAQDKKAERKPERSTGRTASRTANQKTADKTEPKQKENNNKRPVKTGVTLGKNSQMSSAKPKPEIKPEMKPEVKPETPVEEKKPEVIAEPKAEPKMEPQVEAKSEPEVRPEVKPEAKPEVKPEAKPETKPEEKAPAEEATKEEPKKKAGSVPEPVRKKIRAALKDMQLVASNYTSIYKAMANSDDKNDYHNALMKTFGNEKAAEIYKRTKAIFTDYQ